MIDALSADPRTIWDEEAEEFDLAADHGLRDPEIRMSWRGLLEGLLPASPARVADMGCGTGTLSLLLAEMGHEVDGLDFSKEMIKRARIKAAKTPGASFTLGDVSDPALDPGLYDVVLCRHVLWALPDPVAALRRWCELLVPEGRLVLVEGRWSTGAGLTASETLSLVHDAGCVAETKRLDDTSLWGREISDQRYAVSARRAA